MPAALFACEARNRTSRAMFVYLRQFARRLGPSCSVSTVVLPPDGGMPQMHRKIVVLVTIISLGVCAAWSDPPSTVPAERCPHDPGGAEYEIALELSRTSPQFEAYLAFGWQNDGDYHLLVLGDRETSLLRVDAHVSDVLDRSDHSALPPGRDRVEVLLRRRGAEVIVSSEDDLLCHGFVEEPLTGKAGAWPVAGCEVGEVLIQPLGDIEFSEDFFERETIGTRWETLRGSWQLGALWDPLLKRDKHPPQASWYESGEGECLTASGQPFWDRFRLEATVRLQPGGSGGLAFHVRGVGDACALVIHPTQDGSGGKARIVSWVGGEARPMGEREGRFLAGRSYRLAVDVCPGRAEAYVNGNPVVAADLPLVLTGRVGLYASGAPGSRFDDVTARGLRAVRDPFQAQWPERWTSRGGEWVVKDGVLHGHTGPGQVATLLAGEWNDCRVSARVTPGNGATAGLVAHHESGDHAYVFTITAGGQPTWHLHAVTGGETSKLAEGQAPSAAGEMALSFVGGRLICSLNGEQLSRLYDFNVAPGRAGVYVGGGVATFDDFRCAELWRDPLGVVCDADGTGTRVPALEEKQMLAKIGDLWRPLSGRWRTTTSDAGPTIVGAPAGERPGAIRYFLTSPGDPRVIARGVRLGEGGQFGLALCAGEDEGYRFMVSPSEGKARLSRLGEPVAELDGLDVAAMGPATVEILRDGPWIVGRLGEQRGIAFCDAAPLPSGFAEVHVSGGEVQVSRLTLASDTAPSYRFDRVEADWVPASGVWTDHSGMACILWDYWLTGDARQEAALTWNLRRMSADVTLDVMVSEHTVGYPDGDHRHFPYHDIRLVLGGCPGEPESGYAFIVGADGGRRTRLLREGTEVARTDDPRFRIAMGGHCNSPRAVSLRAASHGGHLSLIFNGRLALEWDDPVPLPGGHVGLGAEGCRANFRDCVVYPDLTWQ